MNNAFLVAFALLLIATLIWDNRGHPAAWHDTEED